MVTDANIVLGRINQHHVLGGRLKINSDLSRQAVLSKIAEPMGLSVEAAAQGVISVVNSNMARAIRVITVEKGYNPSDFILVAYGGAGPLHAVQLARGMGIGTVLIPPAPGALCALGLLTADIKKSYVRTALTPFDAATPDLVESFIDPLIKQGDSWLAMEKVAPERRRFHNVAEMRYVGQNYELQVEIPNKRLAREDLEKLRQDFFKAHEQNYGYYNPYAPVQFVNFRVEAIGQVMKPGLAELEAIMDDPAEALVDTRDVYFEDTGNISCPVYDRTKFGRSERVDGPCIIEQMDSTTVIPPGAWFKVDGHGNLIVSAFVKQQD